MPECGSGVALTDAETNFITVPVLGTNAPVDMVTVIVGAEGGDTSYTIGPDDTMSLFSPFVLTASMSKRYDCPSTSDNALVETVLPLCSVVQSGLWGQPRTTAPEVLRMRY